MNIGGAETFIMNIYRNIDREKIQFDFVIHTNEKCDYEDEIKQLGGRIYRISQFSKHPLKNMIELGRIIKNNTDSYKIIDRHTDSSIVFTDLLVAKICGVKHRYVHAHSNCSPKARILHKLFRPILNVLATREFACSKDAAKWLFGKEESSKIEIIYNGIDIDSYLFNLNTRNRIRLKENCKDKVIIGHVGRFTYSKNHIFIIQIFNELLKINPNYELWLIGDGQLRKEIENIAYKYNIESKIHFFGKRTDINELLQAIDIFIFPSIYEGLGISLIEAQISGLFCIISDRIQKEAIITNNVEQIELEPYNVQKWVDAIIRYKYNLQNRYIENTFPRIHLFDIKKVSKRLQDIYVGDINENKK